MKINNTGHSAKFLKRSAKALKRELGITHIEALNLVSQNHGYKDWKQFVSRSGSLPVSKPLPVRPKVPVPAVLNYRDMFTKEILGQHPNAKMSPRRHEKVGDILYELINTAEYHKRAKRYLEDIRRILDTWLGCEYDESIMDNAEFNRKYYAKGIRVEFETNPSARKLAELKRKLRKAKRIIDLSYHDCPPLEKLHELFFMAEKSLDKWPSISRMPDFNRLKGQILPGTFIRIGNSKRIGLVFYHDKQKDAVEGYSDAGTFLMARHEVTIIRQQPVLSDFKPMRLFLPYGKWICADGREVLFNRDYKPIWERSGNGVVYEISPEIEITYETQEYIFESGKEPYRGNRRSLKSCMAILEQWGVSDKVPKVIEIFHAAVRDGDFGSIIGGFKY